jgi:hypothetical protein
MGEWGIGDFGNAFLLTEHLGSYDSSPRWVHKAWCTTLHWPSVDLLLPIPVNRDRDRMRMYRYKNIIWLVVFSVILGL